MYATRNQLTTLFLYLTLVLASAIRRPLRDPAGGAWATSRSHVRRDPPISSPVSGFTDTATTTTSTMADGKQAIKALDQLDSAATHEFVLPKKQINDGEDVGFFLTSTGYADIMTWLLQLNAAMFPKKTPSSYEAWQLNSEAVQLSEPVARLKALMGQLEAIIDEAPPDPGPRRFGNISFRKWYEIVESRLPKLLDEALSADILSSGKPTSAKDELQAYLVGSFGSAQRLDYGTGHELSFLAFLGGIWKLGGFAKSDPGVEERGIVIGVIEP